jgi:hypothetical protein
MSYKLIEFSIKASQFAFNNCPDKDNNIPVWEGLFAGNFAELILNECVDICKDHPDWTGRMIENEIRNRFDTVEDSDNVKPN